MQNHRLLAIWAADCAEHLLPWFEIVSIDPRPREAIELGRAWARGEVSVGRAQKASVAAHAAAREINTASAVAAARAAGHAVATAHFADHCLGPVIYGLKAVSDSEAPMEYQWQMQQLPAELRSLIISALETRLPNKYKHLLQCEATHFHINNLTS